MVILTSKWSSFPNISHKGVPEYQACLSAVHCRPGPSNEVEDALEVDSGVEKTPRIRLEVPADFADRADNDQLDCDANYALARRGVRCLFF